MCSAPVFCHERIIQKKIHTFVNELIQLDVIMTIPITKRGLQRVAQADEMLWKQARKDSGAMAALLQQHYVFLHKYMLKVTMNRTLAEDLVQDTMVKAIENIGTYEGRSKFSTWLISIATRLYLDRLRRLKREKRWQENEQAQALRALKFEALSAGSEWPDAAEALAELDDDVRLPILLKYYYGYTVDEIAAWMDIPSGTVKSRIHNGLKKLRKELTADDATTG
jgi:RNA polymerase sigma-70 factor, ECF subfamily